MLYKYNHRVCELLRFFSISIMYLGFPGVTSGKGPPCQCRKHKRSGLIPGWGRSPRGGNGNPIQHPCLENPMDREAWWATVHRVAKSWTQLSNLAHSLVHSSLLPSNGPCLVAQSSPTLCNPTDYTVHGILQARILQGVAVPSPRASSQPRDGAQVSRTAGGFFAGWATRQALMLHGTSAQQLALASTAAHHLGGFQVLPLTNTCRALVFTSLG